MSQVQQNNALGLDLTLPYKIGDYVEYYVEADYQLEPYKQNVSKLTWYANTSYNDFGQWNSGTKYNHQTLPCPFCPTNNWNSTSGEYLGTNTAFYSRLNGVYRPYYTNDYNGPNGTRRWLYYKWFHLYWSDASVYSQTSYYNQTPETKTCPKCTSGHIYPKILKPLKQGIIMQVKINYTTGDENVKLNYLIQPCDYAGKILNNEEAEWITFTRYKDTDCVINSDGDWMGTPIRMNKHNYNEDYVSTVYLHVIENGVKTILTEDKTNEWDGDYEEHWGSKTSSPNGVSKQVWDIIDWNANLYNIKGTFVPSEGAE